MGSDYAHHANDEILTIAMVETKEALDNLEAISSVAGLDMIFVGTGDLRLSLAVETAPDNLDSQIDLALDNILESCQKHNLIAGLFTESAESAGQMIKRGFRFVTVKTDSVILIEYAKQLVNHTRSTIQ